MSTLGLINLEFMCVVLFFIISQTLADVGEINAVIFLFFK